MVMTLLRNGVKEQVEKMVEKEYIMVLAACGPIVGESVAKMIEKGGIVLLNPAIPRKDVLATPGGIGTVESFEFLPVERLQFPLDVIWAPLVEAMVKVYEDARKQVGGPIIMPPPRGLIM